MLTLEIKNDGTGRGDIGNYDYRVLVNGREIAHGRVEGHYRPDGWESLVWTLAGQAANEKRMREDAALIEVMKLSEDTPNV